MNLQQSSKDFEEKLQLIKQELSCTADSKQELIEKLEQSSTILAEKVKAQLEQEKLLEEIKHNSTNKEEEFNVLQISTNENIEQLTQKIEELESAKKQLEVQFHPVKTCLIFLIKTTILVLDDFQCII